ncbi:erythromycin esterase family protein [Streptomyces sp. NPDC096079]|uniref:erythromycin esterase family protein n=1 Tax=Streptomyces sp. NPDC096079 TaxID=3155820 RepID=UPI003321C983
MPSSCATGPWRTTCCGGSATPATGCCCRPTTATSDTSRPTRTCTRGPRAPCCATTLGSGYAAIGFSFAGGSFLTKDAALDGDWKPVTVPAARPGMNEHLLDRVGYRDFCLDLRTVPAAARAWFDRARPVYDAGSTFIADPLPSLALGRAYDALIHLHRVRAADKLRRGASAP